MSSKPTEEGESKLEPDVIRNVLTLLSPERTDQQYSEIRMSYCDHTPEYDLQGRALAYQIPKESLHKI